MNRAAKELTIECPHCHLSFPLTDSLAAPLLAAKQAELEATLAAERKKIAELERERARAALQDDLAAKEQETQDLKQRLKAKDEKLAEAQKQQAEALKRERELEDRERELEVTIEKRVNAEKDAIREQAHKTAAESTALHIAEQTKLIGDLRRQLDEMKRKAEQGSQQLQGEVQEIALENMLREAFPRDSIEPVPKGMRGADVVHRVFTASGAPAGVILWESKRTKNWQTKWIDDLKANQREAKADIAVLASQVLPKEKEAEPFGLVEGVWVVEYRLARPVAGMLRQSLLQTAMAKAVREGQLSKQELVYEYLTSHRFKQRIQAAIDAFKAMQTDLDRERTAMQKMWAKRQQHIDQIVDSTAGLYGDLQGIAGQSMGEIEALELPALPEPHGDG